MTDNGTFIINGTERVIVSQLHRSPGRLLHQGGAAHLPRQDHSVPRLVGGVRVRPEGHPVGPHRPQAQVPRHRVPARARARDRRVDPAPVLRRRAGCASKGRRQVHAHRAARRCSSRSGSSDRQTPRPPRDLPDLRRHHAHQADGRRSSKSGEASTSTVDVRRARARAASSPTSSTSRPARCCFEANDSLPEDIAERLEGRNHTPIEVFFPDWDLSGSVLVEHAGQGRHHATPRKR